MRRRACPVERIFLRVCCLWHFDKNGKLFENGLETVMWTESFHAIFKQRGPSAAKGSAPFACPTLAQKTEICKNVQGAHGV